MEDKKLVYPEWVQQYRKKGTTIKKKGDKYYLYKRTSKRVPNKKYPQPVDTYLGVITQNGVIYAEKKLVPADVCDVYEYGFSKVLQIICPKEWKEAVGDDWKEVLLILISRKSELTYLAHEIEIPDEKEHPQAWDAQYGRLIARIRKIYNVERRELECLKNIFIVYHDKVRFISRISENQRNILSRLGIEELEVY